MGLSLEKKRQDQTDESFSSYNIVRCIENHRGVAIIPPFGSKCPVLKKRDKQQSQDHCCQHTDPKWFMTGDQPAEIADLSKYNSPGKRHVERRAGNHRLILWVNKRHGGVNQPAVCK